MTYPANGKFICQNLIYKMPNYSYYCNGCTKSFELFYSIKDYQDHPGCDCGSKDTHRDYITDVGSIFGSVKKSNSELKTLGDLANRNRDNMCEDQRQLLFEKHNSYKEDKSEKDLPKGMSRIKKTKQKTKWTNK